MAEKISQVPVRGGRFSVELRQDGSGPPLVFLHGAGGLPGWPPFLARLAEQYTVYAPSHPGWGGSTGIEELNDDIRDLAFFYLDFFDALGLDRAHVIGHSLGGMLAAEIAAMDRSYLDRLVLVCPAGLWLEDNPMPDLFVMEPHEFFSKGFHDPEGPAAQARKPPEEFEAAKEAFLARYQALAAAGKFLWPIPDQGTARRLHRVTVPTLIIWGQSDGFIPVGYGAAFQKAIPGARLEIVKEAGHFVLDEQTDAVCELVTEFLNGG